MPVSVGHARACTWPRGLTHSTNCLSCWVWGTGPCAARHDVLRAGCLGSGVEAREAKIRAPAAPKPGPAPWARLSRKAAETSPPPGANTAAPGASTQAASSQTLGTAYLGPRPT